MRYLSSAPWRGEIDATLVYSASMAGYADPARPLVLDLCDLDSEKWFEYDRLRSMPFAYAIESRRLRSVEQAACARANSTILMTENEAALVRQTIPEARVEIIANGVDFDYWQPLNAAAPSTPSIAFVGQLDYFPNSDGVEWFARDVFPQMRAMWPELEFVIAGRNPGHHVNQLSSLPGVLVVANPDDVRPILASATAVVVPLRLARGLQNKVLEALAMGKQVLTTPQVARTFGGAVPEGITVCETPDDWLAAFRAASVQPRMEIRESLRRTYDWEVAADRLSSLIERAKAAAYL
jgi:glycosyltransferase involved in cell wall biosynthesis